jgi:molybdopterin-guanine dinucleotide biosynthesis protein A
VVLAGGRAARLGGADKPGLVIGGRPLLDVVAGAAVAAGARELIIVGPRRPDLIRIPPGRGPDGDIPVRWVSEDPPGSGPVPALRCGLAAVTGEAVTRAGQLVLVLAADLPFLRSGPLTALAGAVRGGVADGAVLADEGGRPQWLISCWRYGPLRAGLDNYAGHSLRGLFGTLRPAWMGWPRDDGEPPPWLDCDTPEAVDQARAWVSR